MQYKFPTACVSLALGLSVLATIAACGGANKSASSVSALASTATPLPPPSEIVRAGKLRVALSLANTTLVVKDPATGELHGVAV